jgi:NhaP-type Na+/H+ or K+/H+ antiporter
VGAARVTGAAGAAAGVAVLWFCLCKLNLGDVLATTSQLAVVVGVATVCDIGRDDAGFFAAVSMGLALANLRAFDIPAQRPFFETLVQLIIGVLFVSISATVTPESLHHLVPPALGLVAVLVLVARPLVAFLATIRADLARAERQFTGWMAPRGIVAAASASTFGAGLAAPAHRRCHQDPAGYLPGHRRHCRPIRADRGPGGPAAGRRPPGPHPARCWSTAIRG